MRSGACKAPRGRQQRFSRPQRVDRNVQTYFFGRKRKDGHDEASTAGEPSRMDILEQQGCESTDEAIEAAVDDVETLLFSGSSQASDASADGPEQAREGDPTDLEDPTVSRFSGRQRPEVPVTPPPMPQRIDPHALFARRQEAAEAARSAEGTPTAPLQTAANAPQGPSASAADGIRLHALVAPPQIVEEPAAPHVTFGVASMLAAGVLAALRLGRHAALEEELSSRTLRDIVEARLRAAAAQAAAQGEDAEVAAERIREAKAKAARAAEVEARKQREYAEAAAREAERERARREAKRQEYEALEAAREAELARRIELDRKLATERAEAARVEAERVRREREEAAARAAAEEAARKEEERQATEAEARAAAAERAELAKQRKEFVVRAEGRVAVAHARPGLKTETRVPVDARFEVSAEAQNLLTGPVGTVLRGAATRAEAEDIAISVAGETAHNLIKALSRAYTTQNATGSGPLQMMDHIELKHWLRKTCMIVHASCTAHLRDAVKNIKPSQDSHSVIDEYKVRSSHGVLPAGHERRADARLGATVAAVQATPDAADQAVAAALERATADEREAFDAAVASDARISERVAAPYLLEICIAAQFVDRAAELWPAREMSAPSWYEAAVSASRHWLNKVAQSAPPDSLLDASELTCWALGDDHPVSQHVVALAEANMSSAKKRAVVQRAQALDAAVAQAMMAAEREVLSRDRKALNDQQALEKQEMTPIPERVWALRNVAASMAMSGAPSSRRRAREYLETALRLQRERFEEYDGVHPGLLGELWRLAQLLHRDEDTVERGQELLQEVVDIVEAVLARYRRDGDLVSAAALAEGSCIALESYLPSDDPAMRRLDRTAETLVQALDEAERDKVVAARRKVEAIDRLADKFTDVLEVYSQRTGHQRLEEWERGQRLDPFI